MAGLTGIILLIVGLLLIALPVRLAASAMGARRTGFFWCFFALIGASVLHSIGLSLPVFGTIAAFLLAAAAFAAILGTGFLRGIGIAVLHAVFSWLLVLVIGAVLGVGAISLFTIF